MDDEDSSIRYVASGAPTGWAAMAKTVRDYDEEKIRDCKEDIDTLLVFAGLFSAILTAFLIQFYQELQENPNDVTVQLLKQIALQTSSYTFASGYLNATFQTTPPSPFTAPSPAIYINELWFVSLLFSLVSASLGILVKQWLREYLAGEYTSPQARLRIRQFRNPGLKDWKVFEIAAVLPLLLQISLGLFFIGLCIFTWTVHPALGKVCTPIVAGWAFIFFLVTLAPALSSRCPYKTILLKPAMRSLRRLLREVPALRPLYEKQLATFGDSRASSGPVSSISKITVFEEEEAAGIEHSDLGTLIAVDAILLDDDLLGTTMWESIRQSDADPSDVLTFVHGVLGRRLNQTIPFGQLERLLELRTLTKRAWSAVTNIISDTVVRAIKRQTPSVTAPWMHDALLILLSICDYPFPTQSTKTLSHFFSGTQRREVIDGLGRRLTDADDVGYVLRRLRGIFAECAPRDTISITHDLLVSHLSRTMNPMDNSNFALSTSQRAGEQASMEYLMANVSLSAGLLEAVVDLLVDCLLRCSANRVPDRMTDYDHALTILYAIPIEHSNTPRVLTVLASLLVDSPSTTSTLLSYHLNKTLVDHTSPTRVVDSNSFKLLTLAFKHAATDTRQQILSSLLTIADTYAKQDYRTETMRRESPMKLCRLIASMLESTYHESASASIPLEDWRALWNKLSVTVVSYKYLSFCHIQDVDDNDEEAAEEVLAVLDKVDCSIEEAREQEAVYDKWVHSFHPQTSPVPDEMFIALSEFILDPDIYKHWRLRRICESKASEMRLPMPQRISEHQPTIASAELSVEPADGTLNDMVLTHGQNTVVDQQHDVISAFSISDALPEHLESYLWLPVRQEEEDPSNAIRFVLSELSRRLKQKVPDRLDGLLDLRSLQKRVWLNIISAVAEISIKMFGDAVLPEWTDAMENAVLILLSYTNYTLPRRGFKALSYAFSGTSLHRLAATASDAKHNGRLRFRAASHFVSALKCLRGVFAEFPPDVAALATQFLFNGHRFSRIHPHGATHMRSLDPSAHQVVLDIVLDCLKRRLTGEISGWSEGSSWILEALYSAPVEHTNTPHILETLRAALSDRRLTFWVCTTCLECSLNSNSPTFMEINTLNLLCLTFESADDKARTAILRALMDIAGRYIDRTLYHPFTLRPTNPIKLCRLLTRILEISMKDTTGHSQLNMEWRALWTEVSTAILSHRMQHTYIGQDHHKTYANVAEECLLKLDSLEFPISPANSNVTHSPEEGHDLWFGSFKHEESVIPDELFVALSQFIPNIDSSRYKRLRWIHESSSARGG